MRKKYCQSCGMPLSKDPQHGGLEKDGSRSELYCSFCYSEGEFIQKDMSCEQMQEFVEKQMTSHGMPKFFARMFTKNITGLQRWN